MMPPQLYEDDIETLLNFPEVWLMYNSDYDLICIRIYGGRHTIFEREVDDAAVTNTTIDSSKTIKYKKWEEITDLEV